MKKFITFIFIFLILITPTFSMADGLVPCSNTAVNGVVAEPCDFNALMDMINIIIKFVLFNLALPIAAIMFAYAGFLLVTAGGGEAKTKAKGIFSDALFGLVIAAAGWLIIRTILSVLGYNGAWIGFS